MDTDWIIVERVKGIQVSKSSSADPGRFPDQTMTWFKDLHKLLIRTSTPTWFSTCRAKINYQYYGSNMAAKIVSMTCPLYQ